MEFLINESTKWNVGVPVKGVEANSWIVKYVPSYSDGLGGWFVGSEVTVPVSFPSSRNTEFNPLSSYEKIVYMVKLFNSDFLTEEDKLIVHVAASNVTAEVKTAVNTAIASAVSKFKLLKDSELALTKVAVR